MENETAAGLLEIASEIEKVKFQLEGMSEGELLEFIEKSAIDFQKRILELTGDLITETLNKNNGGYAAEILGISVNSLGGLSADVVWEKDDTKNHSSIILQEIFQDSDLEHESQSNTFDYFKNLNFIFRENIGERFNSIIADKENRKREGK